MAKRRRPSHPRFIKALSLLGLLTLIAFPLAMLFVGFANLDINCTRQHAHQPPDCDLREKRLFGLYDRHLKALAVTGVGYRTQDVAPTARVTLASTVVLEAGGGEIPVSEVSSNLGGEWKSRLILNIQKFLDNPDEQHLSLHIDERNLFGWIGAGFVAFFAMSYLAWFFNKLKGRS